jgi:hypothetical protein
MKVSRLALAQSSASFVLPNFMSLFPVAGYDEVSTYIRNMEPCNENTVSLIELLFINETL